MSSEISTAERAGDERLLWMIGQRCAGVTSDAIANRLGVRPEYVRTATFRVMQADMAHEGRHVAAHYWDTSTRTRGRAA
jgi:hypothetical protein